MKRYDQVSFKTRMLILFVFAAVLVTIVIINEDNTFLNFMKGFTGGMLIAFGVAEMVLFFKKRRKAE